MKYTEADKIAFNFLLILINKSLTRTMTHIKTIGQCCEPKDFKAKIWMVSRDECVECPVCFDELPVSKFAMCENGHLVHEKCLLQQIEGSYALGKTFANNDDMQCCSVCKGKVEDDNCSPLYHKMLPLIISKGYTNSRGMLLCQGDKQGILGRACEAGKEQEEIFKKQTIDALVWGIFGEKDLENTKFFISDDKDHRK